MFGQLSVASLSVPALKLSVVVVESSLQLVDVLLQLDVPLVLVLLAGAGAEQEISVFRQSIKSPLSAPLTSRPQSSWAQWAHYSQWPGLSWTC